MRAERTTWWLVYGFWSRLQVFCCLSEPAVVRIAVVYSYTEVDDRQQKPLQAPSLFEACSPTSPRTRRVLEDSGSNLR